MMAGYKILGLSNPAQNKSGYSIQGKAEENPEDAVSYLDNLSKNEGSHPFRDLLIGLTHAGRNLHNLPHELVKGAENATQDFGKVFESLPGPKVTTKNYKPLSEYLPNDTTDYAETWGQKGEGTLLDKILQKGVEYAPEIIGAGSLIRGGVRRLKGTHQLDEMRQGIRHSNLNEFNYPPEMIEQARRYLPPSRATTELIGDVEAGGFNPAFDMQSQVGYHQRKLAKSPLAAEQRRAPQAGDLKQSMLNHLETVMRTEGLDQEADLLRSGINNFRRYSQIRDAVVPVLKKYGIPTSILASLGFGFKKAKQAFSD